MEQAGKIWNKKKIFSLLSLVFLWILCHLRIFVDFYGFQIESQGSAGSICVGGPA